jgi:hypothetical protein
MRGRVLLLLICGAMLGGACSPNAVCKLAGPINDPSNRTLRRSLMAFGLGKFCQQMTSRNVPLKLAPDAPVIGRFYPAHCIQRQLDNGDLWIEFDGTGYAFTNLSRKVTFRSAATIQYNDDFKCAEDDSIYAYFDTRSVSPPAFSIVAIEQPVASLVENWIAPLAETFGKQIVSGQLGQGFTVIEADDGSTDFDLGHIPVGGKPKHPFAMHGNGRETVDSQRTVVYVGERDFVGPVAIQESGKAIYLTMQLNGQQALDVFLVPKGEGDPSLQAYEAYGPAGPLAYPPRFADVIVLGVQYERAVSVPPGMYYVVIDNTQTAGQVAPPPVPPFGVADSGAVVNYAIQIGDAP